MAGYNESMALVKQILLPFCKVGTTDHNSTNLTRGPDTQNESI